ncbi:MAG: methionyl-tRNA formyltransferase [Thermodesulfobacteriota bacterium]
MADKNYKIIYMGTPGFAVPPLEALYEKGFNIVLVVTQPDKRQGRGKKIVSSPVKNTAEKLGIEIFQPEKIKTDDACEKLQSYDPDFLIVAAYGQILSKKILDIPKLGAINIHASILPYYRGASPIQHAVLNMEKETGITTMLMDEGLDTGDILDIKKTEIGKKETAGMLHDRLSYLGAETVVNTLDNFSEIKPKPQDDSKATYAPLLKKEDGHIDWSQTGDEIDARIRAFNPWPGTFTFYNGERLKIYSIEKISDFSDKKPGTIVKAEDNNLIVSAGDCDVNLLEIQPAGKKIIKTKDFLSGYKIEQETVLT